MKLYYHYFVKVPGGITSMMPSIPEDLLSYINCIENMPVYRGESTLPTRDINFMSLYADSNTNFLSTDLIVSNKIFELNMFIYTYIHYIF